MFRKLIIICISACAALPLWAESREITLEEAILLARVRSVDAVMAVNSLRSAYWEYRTFKAGLLPEINFKATLPGYSKQYSSYQNADGSYNFVRNDNLALKIGRAHV